MPKGIVVQTPAYPYELTLTPDDYRVFLRVPSIWWDESEVLREISSREGKPSREIAARIARFIGLGLVSRRRGATLGVESEIRKAELKARP